MRVIWRFPSGEIRETHQSAVPREREIVPGFQWETLWVSQVIWFPWGDEIDDTPYAVVSLRNGSRR